MRAAMIAPNGRVLSIIDVQDMALAQLGVPAPNFLLGIAPESLDFYWNGTEFIQLGAAPNKYCFFDYELREWFDPRTLDQIKNQRWSEIKTARDQMEFGGFEFEGLIYDSDQVSQARIMGAAVAGIDQIWTLADNTTVELTAQQLKGLYAALQAHVASAHEKGRNARQLIYEAETKEQVEAIQL